MNTRSVVWLEFAVAAACVIGCMEPEPVARGISEMVCRPNEQVPCACEDAAQGFAICAGDGQSFGACRCQTPASNGGALHSPAGGAGSPSAPITGTSMAGQPGETGYSGSSGFSGHPGASGSAPQPSTPQPSNGGGGGGGGYGSNAGGSPSAGGPTAPVPAANIQCYNLTARASAKGDPYTVPTTRDVYKCFNYAPPWGDKRVQVVSARPIIGNERVIHHWILYNTEGPVSDGTNGSCSHPNAAFIAGWAPGGEAMALPDDVGLRIDGAGFTLENHYNNTLGAGQLDASGVEICVTEDLRPKEAAVHWLGTTSLNKINATGTCAPDNDVPVTILSSSPHMHLQGRHLKTIINRKAGGTEVLIDTPFDFGSQVSYATPALIQPGDTLTTTCTFATPTRFGPGTNDEMCFNFVMAYPAGQLARSRSLRKNDCIGL